MSASPLLSVCLAVALGLTTLAYRAAWKRSQTTRNRALREAARERAARVGAYRQLGVWMDRAQRAETVVAGYVMEAAEERARDERIWQNVKAQINAVSGVDCPDDLVIGTAKSPIVLDRTYVDSSLTDTARFASLADLVREAGGKLG